MSALRAWIRAARLPSQSYIALPLIFGQMLALHVTGMWSWPIFVIVALFGIFDQLYIVFANDYADRETDALNETSTVFSGGSRVLVDGSLSPKALFRAAILMAVLAIATGVALLVGWGHALVLPLVLIGLVLLWAYSFAPLRMSYRGGGEFLQMLGVGLVLPLIGYAAQAGNLSRFPVEVFAFLLPLNLATSLSTALPDEPSDRISDKRTLAVLLGGTAARTLIIALNCGGLALFAILVSPAFDDLSWSLEALLALPVLSVVLQVLMARRAAPGTGSILAFVFFSLLCNLSLVALLIIGLATA
jgi:1,4-dihydroxy-2-naphthoate octaprenyltransferase